MSLNERTYGILGYGTVGRATRTSIKSSRLVDGKANFLVYDKDPEKAELPVESWPVRLDALFICLPTHEDQSMLTAVDVAKSIDESIHRYIPDDHELRIGAVIVVRSTVPMGTCDALQEEFSDQHVLYLPEFATEHEMAKGDTNAWLLGVSDRTRQEHQTGQDIWSVFDKIDVGGLPLRTADRLVSCREAEFAKLAHNIRRATDVALNNELMLRANLAGVSSEAAQDVLQDLDAGDIKYASLAFGGKCLQPALKMWDSSTHTALGKQVETINKAGAIVAQRMLRASLVQYKIEKPRVIVIGLSDNPKSTRCFNPPVEHLLEMLIGYGPRGDLLLVDEVEIAENFAKDCPRWGGMRVVNLEHYSNWEYATLQKANVFMLAQHVDPMFVRKVLDVSNAKLKVVINACAMDISIERAVGWSRTNAVVVDPLEASRFPSLPYRA